MAAQHDGGMSVSVKLHDAPAPFHFSDFDGTGHTRNGSIVLSALKNHRQIYTDSSGDDNKMAYIIPYHSVDTYDYEIIPYDGEKPTDAFCEEDPCLDKWTITFYNGETLLGTYTVPNGKVPVYSGTTPTGDTAFIGWSDDPLVSEPLEQLPPATENASYYACFAE